MGALLGATGSARRRVRPAAEPLLICLVAPNGLQACEAPMRISRRWARNATTGAVTFCRKGKVVSIPSAPGIVQLGRSEDGRWRGTFDPTTGCPRRVCLDAARCGLR